MKINFDKKIFLYQVDPLFFYDSNDDGFGDFEGFLKKIDYFNYIDVDGIIFPDIFNQEDIILKNVELSIFDKYGSFNELKEIIKQFKNMQKIVFVEINIQKMLDSMILKKSKDDLKVLNITKFISEENNFWKTEKSKLVNDSRRIEAFKKIIKFWNSIGIDNFIFTDFEHIYEKNNKLDARLLLYLKNLYKLVKAESIDSIVGLKTFYFKNKTINKIFKNKLSIICDLYIDSSFSLLFTEKKHEFDIIKKFCQRKLFQKIKNIKIKPDLSPRYFISLNNNKIGRVNSRWFNEENLIDESNKSLLMFLNLTKFSSVVFYGDEIGTQRLKIENKDEYHDYEYFEKKRKLEFQKYKNFDYEYSQKFLSRINTQSIFVWNDKLNGGFSEAQKIFRKMPINWLTHNLLIEFKDQDSIWNFFCLLIKKVKEISLKISSNNQIKIKVIKKIMLIKIKISDANKLFVINLSKKTVNIKISLKKWFVSLSTYKNKKYIDSIKFLCPYESLILETKGKNNEKN